MAVKEELDEVTKQKESYNAAFNMTNDPDYQEAFAYILRGLEIIENKLYRWLKEGGDNQ